MARLEAGEIQLNIEPVAVATLIEGALHHLKKSLGDRNIILNISPNLAPVRADLERTQDILVQLIDNAHLYSPRDNPSLFPQSKRATPFLSASPTAGPELIPSSNP